MGFYGKVTNSSKTQFTFDRIYPNRTVMEKNAQTDGVFVGRYVLVNYETDINKNDFSPFFLRNLILNQLDGEGKPILGIDGHEVRTIYQTILYDDDGNELPNIVPDLEVGTVVHIPYGASSTYAPGSENPTQYNGLDKNYDNFGLEQYYIVQDVWKYEIAEDTSSFSENTYYYYDNDSREFKLITGSSDFIAKKEDHTIFIESENVLGLKIACLTTAEVVPNNTVNNQEQQSVICKNTYIINFNIDGGKYANSGRGWDSTVWQKTSVYDEKENKFKEKYVMVAELNSVVPTFDVTSDAPTLTPIPAHFDANSTNVYYKLHAQPQWGLRVKNASQSANKEYLWDRNGNYLNSPNTMINCSSDNNPFPTEEFEFYDDDINNSGTQISEAQKIKLGVKIPNPLTGWKRIEYDALNKKLKNFWYNGNVGNGSWIEYSAENRGSSYEDDETRRQVQSAIYFNKAGFNKNESVHTKNRFNYLNEDGEKIEFGDEIKIEPTGISGHTYNVHEENRPQTAEDIQEISISLPSIGDTMADVWDLIYGDGKLNMIEPEENGDITHYLRNTHIDNLFSAGLNVSENYQGLRLVKPEELGNVVSRDSNIADHTVVQKTVAGALNSVNDALGRILVNVDEWIEKNGGVYHTECDLLNNLVFDDIELRNNNDSASWNRIYYMYSGWNKEYDENSPIEKQGLYRESLFTQGENESDETFNLRKKNMYDLDINRTDSEFGQYYFFDNKTITFTEYNEDTEQNEIIVIHKPTYTYRNCKKPMIHGLLRSVQWDELPRDENGDEKLYNYTLDDILNPFNKKEMGQYQYYRIGTDYKFELVDDSSSLYVYKNPSEMTTDIFTPGIYYTQDNGTYTQINEYNPELSVNDYYYRTIEDVGYYPVSLVHYEPNRYFILDTTITAGSLSNTRYIIDDSTEDLLDESLTHYDLALNSINVKAGNNGKFKYNYNDNQLSWYVATETSTKYGDEEANGINSIEYINIWPNLKTDRQGSEVRDDFNPSSTYYRVIGNNIKTFCDDYDEESEYRTFFYVPNYYYIKKQETDGTVYYVLDKANNGAANLGQYQPGINKTAVDEETGEPIPYGDNVQEGYYYIDSYSWLKYKTTKTWRIDEQTIQIESYDVADDGRPEPIRVNVVEFGANDEYYIQDVTPTTASLKERQSYKLINQSTFRHSYPWISHANNNDSNITYGGIYETVIDPITGEPSRDPVTNEIITITLAEKLYNFGYIGPNGEDADSGFIDNIHYDIEDRKVFEDGISRAIMNELKIMPTSGNDSVFERVESNEIYISGKYYVETQKDGKLCYELHIVSNPTTFRSSKLANLTFYTITNPNPIMAFWKPETYYYKVGENTYIKDSGEYDSNKEYYSLNEYYVYKDTRGIYKGIVDVEEDGIGISGAKFNIGTNSRNRDIKIPSSLILAKRIPVAVFIPLTDFARTTNSVHGLILKINRMLEYANSTDDGNKEIRNELTRDQSTVQGTINVLNDCIAKFGETNVGDVIVTDDYGRYQGAKQTTKQQFGYINYGDVTNALTPNTTINWYPAIDENEETQGREDEWLYWNVNADAEYPEIKINHRTVYSDETSNIDGISHRQLDTTKNSSMNTVYNTAIYDNNGGANSNDINNLKLYSPIVDIAGHIVGKNIETVELPHTFSDVKARNSSSTSVLQVPTDTNISYGGNTALDKASTNNELSSIKVHDTLSFASGNKWLKVRADMISGSNNDDGLRVITISHGPSFTGINNSFVNTINNPASSQFVSRETNPNGLTLEDRGAIDFPVYSFDNAGHISGYNTSKINLELLASYPAYGASLGNVTRENFTAGTVYEHTNNGDTARLLSKVQISKLDTVAQALIKLENAVDRLNSTSQTRGSVSWQISNLINLTTDDASAFDTLREIAQWIRDEGNDVSINKFLSLTEVESYIFNKDSDGKIIYNTDFVTLDENGNLVSVNKTLDERMADAETFLSDSFKNAVLNAIAQLQVVQRSTGNIQNATDGYMKYHRGTTAPTEDLFELFNPQPTASNWNPSTTDYYVAQRISGTQVIYEYTKVASNAAFDANEYYYRKSGQRTITNAMWIDTTNPSNVLVKFPNIDNNGQVTWIALNTWQ